MVFKLFKIQIDDETKEGEKDEDTDDDEDEIIKK